MFKERGKLFILQKEYESGMRSSESLKQEAQRIVRENLSNITTITTSCKEQTEDGREKFDVMKTMKQIWIKVKTKGICMLYISTTWQQNMDPADKYIVQLYFQVSSSSVSKEANLFSVQHSFFQTSLAYRFAKSMHMSLLKSDDIPLVPNKPLDGAVGIEAITLSQTANDEVKFRIILKSAYPQQKTFRDVYVPRVQSWARRTLARRYAKRFEKAIIIIKRYVKKWVKKNKFLTNKHEEEKKRTRRRR